jgi:hypothetical protein
MANFWCHGPLPPGNPLFRGRQAELSRVWERCHGELRSYLIVFGGRQVGKTSLFNQLPGFLGKEYLVCRLDLQSLTGATPEQVYSHIAKKLGTLVALKQSASSASSSAQLSHLVLRVASQIHQDKLVLLFEELGSLPSTTANALANLLRSWFNGRFDPGWQAFGRVMVILAGSIELYELAAVEVSPLSNISESLYMPDLTAAEAIGLIAEGMGDLGLPPDLSNQLGEAVYELVGGHPYLTQQLGEMLETACQKESPSADVVSKLGHTALVDTPLVHHLRHALNELKLWAVIPALLSGEVQHSRHDVEMALLELLGLATEREGCWAVRNIFFEQILNDWQGGVRKLKQLPRAGNSSPSQLYTRTEPQTLIEQTSPQDRQRQRLAELQQQWQDLSERIAALVKDIGVTTDSEQALVLTKRQRALEAEREALEPELQRLEEALGTAPDHQSSPTNGEMMQGSRLPPSSSSQGERSGVASAPNPFGDVGCITDPARFFDREELLRQIFEELGKGVNISLVGESQVGKSSLLTMVCKWGPEQLSLSPGAFAYLNLEVVENEDDFYEALCEALGIETCRGFKLTRILRGRRIVLCLDEIEKMAWEGFTVRLRSQLRGLADGSDSPLKLVIASRSPLSHLFPDSPELDSPLASVCHQVDVGPFPPDVARAFLAHRLRGTSVAFTEHEVSKMLVETDGNPAKLQQVAAGMYAMRST